RLPAVALLKRMVRDGAVGEVRLWRGVWLSDEFVDPAIPFDWRFDRAMSGATIADLGAPLIDLARAVAGEIDAVVAQSGAFVRERGAGPRGRPGSRGGDRRRLVGAAPLRPRRAGRDRAGGELRAPAGRLQRRGEGEPGAARLRLPPPQRALVRLDRRRS